MPSSVKKVKPTKILKINLFFSKEIYMKVYKIVCNVDGQLKSTNSSCRVIYKLGKWTKPKIQMSRLFVFDTIENARKGLAIVDGTLHEIYECEARGVIKARYLNAQLKWKTNPVDRMRARWKLFNTLVRQHKAAALPFCFPNGTLFAKEVKLVKRVPIYPK